MPSGTPVRLLFLLFFTGVWGRVVEAAPAVSNDLIYEAWLDRDNNFLMRWTPEKDRIVIEIQVATQGWVGLGFSPTGGMKGSDVVMAWVDDSTGEVTFHDRYSDSDSTPTIDPSQDYELLSGHQTEGRTVVRFARPWVTCDRQFDWELNGDTQRVIWAYGSEDPEDLMHFSWHHHRSSKSLLLIDPPTSANDKILEGAKTWDARSPNVHLSDETDSYICSLHKIPRLEAKHQIIGFTHIIDGKNIEYVHHIVLHECMDEEELPPYLDSSFDCYGADMMPKISACQTPVTAWAVGGEDEIYPENVGYPFGETKYFMLEVHYNNAKLKKNITDSSGIRVLYTDKLRENEAGTLVIGEFTSPEMIIPPGMGWTTTVQCPQSCIEGILPSSGVKIFGSLLHTHLLGTSVSVRVLRDGKELPPIFKDSKFDYNYQQTRKLPIEFTIKPGDTILLDCKYDTTSKKKPSFGGYGTAEEMCIVFMYIYPKISSAGCYSRTRFREILSMLNVTHINLEEVNYEMPTPEVMGLFEMEYRIQYLSQNNNESKSEGIEVPEPKEDQNWKPSNSLYLYKKIKISGPEALSGKTMLNLLEETDWANKGLTSQLEHLPKDSICMWDRFPNSSKVYDIIPPEFEPYQEPPRPCVRGMALKDSPANVLLSDQPKDPKEAKEEGKSLPSDEKETGWEGEKGNTSQVMRRDQPVAGEEVLNKEVAIAEDQPMAGNNMPDKKSVPEDDEPTAEPHSKAENKPMTEDNPIETEPMAEPEPVAEPEPTTENKNMAEDKAMSDKDEGTPPSDESEDKSMSDEGEDKSMSDEGEDKSMSDEGEDKPMSDKGEDKSMSDEGDDKPMSDEGENKPMSGEGEDKPMSDEGEGKPMSDEDEGKPTAEDELMAEPESPTENMAETENKPMSDKNEEQPMKESELKTKNNPEKSPEKDPERDRHESNKEEPGSSRRTSTNVDPSTSSTSERTARTDSSIPAAKSRKDIDPPPDLKRSLASPVLVSFQLFHLLLLLLLARSASFTSLVYV